ncbi:hypothetical protein [Paenibacillus sp. FSL H8-0034]|uniref:hypothetical protein n=1 Tax=Paenibacillus sp. FSL H8-0034 TaxID=2954671 RepID=UPI0030FB3A27
MSVNISKDRVSDTSITIPTVKVETPVAGLQTDTLNISNDQSKGVSIRIPEVKVESPIVQVQTPSVQATVPLVPGALPDLQVQSPSIQVETPVMNVEVPSVPIQTSPDIIIVPPPTKVEIPVSSVEIPTFPIDKDEDVNVGNSATDVSVKPPSSEPSSNNNSLTASGDGGKLSVLGEETSLNPTIKDMPSRVEVGGNEPVVIPKPNGAAIEPEQRIAYPETFIDKPLFDQSHEDTGQKIKPDQHYPAPTAKKNAPIEQTLPLPQPRNQLPIPLLYVASSVGQAGASSNAGGSAFGSGNGSFNGKPMSLYSESALPSPVELNLSYARLQLLGSNQWSQPPPGQPPQTLSSHSTVF